MKRNDKLFPVVYYIKAAVSTYASLDIIEKAHYS